MTKVNDLLSPSKTPQLSSKSSQVKSVATTGKLTVRATPWLCPKSKYRNKEVN